MAEQEDALAGVLAAVTPARIAELVRRLAADRPAGRADHLEVSAVMEALLSGATLPEGPEGWRARLRLERAIATAIAEAPGLVYVEGDS